MKDRHRRRSRDGTFDRYIGGQKVVHNRVVVLGGERRYPQDLDELVDEASSGAPRPVWRRAGRRPQRHFRGRPGATAFASIRPMTGAPGQGTWRSTPTLSPNSPTAPARFILGCCLGD